MSWNGQVPSQANWEGAPQFPGSEVLYTTPDPATTATNPSIGIVDGNEIPLPTAYNTLAVDTLTSGTINNTGTITTDNITATTGDITTVNSTTINNTGTITSATGDITTLNSTTINNTGTITSATGDITTLNSTTINNSGTITSATGDITTLNSTTINNTGTITSATGDITTLNSTTINNSGTIITNLVNAAIGDITTINSTNINNADNINTITINGNAIPIDAQFWSNYQAVNNVVARDAPRNAYVPNLWYTGFASYVSYGTPYQNYETFIAGAGINPGNRLDPYDPNANYTGFLFYSFGATYNGIQYLSIGGNLPAPNTVPPPDPTYWRLAEYQPTFAYITGNLTFHTATNAWYSSIAGSTGVAPPNPSYWNVYQRWVVLTSPNLLGLKYWNISNFNDIASTTSHVYQANATVAEITTGNITNVTSQNINNTDTLTTRVGNVNTTLNIGTSGLLADGGILNVGTSGLNPTSTPQVTVGNTSFNRCAVKIYGESNLSAFPSLLVKGGVTMDAGAFSTSAPAVLQNHGIDLFACNVAATPPEVSSTLAFRMKPGVAGVGAGIDMISVLPNQPISITARTGIIQITSQLLGTYIAANTGLYVSSASNTYAGGRIFTDHICPGYTSGNVLLIDGRNDLTSGVTGVQIDNGTTWNCNTLNATTLNASGNVVATGNVSCVDLTSTGDATLNNLVVADATAADLTTLTYVNIPESNTFPADWDGGTTYDQYALVIYVPTGTLYFSLVAANQGNDPSTSPAFWLLANWDVATTYSIGNPTFVTATQSFWTSLQNSNTGNFPTTPPNWEVGITYGNGAIVVYNALHYQSLQAANTGNLPDDVGSVWWVNIPIYWTPNTTSYNIGNTNTGLVFTPIVSGFTGITTLVKRLGDPDEELNVIVKTPQNVELSAQSVVVSPMYKDFDMGTQNITNLGSITGSGALTLTAGVGQTVNIQSPLQMNNNNIINSGDITASASMIIDALGGYLALNSSTGDLSLTADTFVAIGTTNSYISLTAGGGSNVEINSPLDMNNNNIVGGNTITGTTALTLATLSNGNLNLSPNGTGLIEANKSIDMNNNDIVGGNNITGTTALTLATLSNGNLNLSPNGTGIIEANKGIDMNNNNIVGGNTITGTGALTLATTGATNLNLSPGIGGLIVAGKGLSMGTNSITNCLGLQSATGLAITTLGGTIEFTPSGTNRTNFNTDCGFNNKTLYNFTGTNVGGIYGLTTQALALVGQQATPAVQIRGSLTMWLNSTTQAPGNSIAGVTTLNGRNLFAYGNFYNTATQTLTATNTATLVKMNTSLNNNLITLDTTTNIGRITFTNAGVYHVVWNAYLFHGSGGTAKSVIWIRLNGTDVAGSGKTENNDASQNETNLTSSAMVSVTASQYIEFYWAADSVSVPLTAVAAVAPYPATPSFSCTISIVG